ncbi:hypothetical protein RFI_29431 [Reticulomyxa filosa]|uniref:Uncharacterized protein n=1 Tax=Reticulomyxa filosa TaxID=46433 RepID=X6M1E1_RETFI|nr:hypothetical protein RFI_29431 [Reticulomyxa filosa]|eukprot:ETO07958.1 hypothetical protein RFI_29431 [Reticulomyxa filosa]
MVRIVFFITNLYVLQKKNLCNSARIKTISNCLEPRNNVVHCVTDENVIILANLCLMVKNELQLSETVLLLLRMPKIKQLNLCVNYQLCGKKNNISINVPKSQYLSIFTCGLSSMQWYCFLLPTLIKKRIHMQIKKLITLCTPPSPKGVKKVCNLFIYLFFILNCDLFVTAITSSKKKKRVEVHSAWKKNNKGLYICVYVLFIKKYYFVCLSLLIGMPPSMKKCIFLSPQYINKNYFFGCITFKTREDCFFFKKKNVDNKLVKKYWKNNGKKWIKIKILKNKKGKNKIKKDKNEKRRNKMKKNEKKKLMFCYKKKKNKELKEKKKKKQYEEYW